MKNRIFPLAAAVAFFIFALKIRSSQPPTLAPEPEAIQTLLAGKSGNDIVLSCTDGGTSVQFISNSSVFFDNTTSFNSSVSATCTFTDVGTLSLSTTAYYQGLSLANSPFISSTTPLYAKPGDTITLRGGNLDGATLISPAGTVIPSVINTRDRVTFLIPATGMVSGRVQLNNSHDNNAGSAKSGFIVVFNFIPSVNNTLYDASFYQDATDTTRRLMVTSREGALNKVYVINPVDLTNNSITLAAGVPNPMGQSLGVLSDSKNYLFYGPGNVTFGSLTATPVYKLDFLAVPPVQSLFRNISFANGNDNANVRATSFIPISGGAPENEVLVFNPNPSSGNQFDIRLGKEVTTGFTTWANLGIAVNGTTIDRNYPAGIGVRDNGVTNGKFSFYATNGKQIATTPVKSQVLYYNSDTASPPNHALLWTSPFDAADTAQRTSYITNAAQIAKESWGEQFVFLADRGNSNPPFGFSVVPSRVFKLNANNCLVAADCPAAGATKAFVSAFDYNKAMSDIHGVAIQRGKNQLGDPYSKFLHLVNKLPAGFPVTGYGISQVRALREIPIKVFIASHAGWGPGYPYAGDGVWPTFINRPIGIPQLQEFVNSSVTESNKILYDAGYQIGFNPTQDMQTVDDSNITVPGYNYSIRVLDELNGCPAELMQLAARAPITQKGINIFIVHAIGLTKMPYGSYEPASGITHSYRLLGGCGGMKEVILINYVSSVGTGAQCSSLANRLSCNRPASFHALAHELYHRLTILIDPAILSAAGYTTLPTNYGHRAAPCDHHLMCESGDTPENTGFLLSSASATDRDDDLANCDGIGATYNDGTSFILPDQGVP